MDIVTWISFIFLAALLVALGRWTQAQRGPFAAVLRRGVPDIAPHTRAIAYTLYGTAVASMIVAGAAALISGRMTTFSTWAPIAIIVAAVCAGQISRIKDARDHR
jgi:hypothetical protein